MQSKALCVMPVRLTFFNTFQLVVSHTDAVCITLHRAEGGGVKEQLYHR